MFDKFSLLDKIIKQWYETNHLKNNVHRHVLTNFAFIMDYNLIVARNDLC